MAPSFNLMPSPRSLRFQLPLSYAGIALVAALALGAVLLYTLRGYYQAQERAYLLENALALSYGVSEMIDSGVSNDVIEAQVKSLSLLTLARIQVRDTDDAHIADSGVPDGFQIYSLAGGGGPSQIFVSQFSEGSQEVTKPITDVVIIRSDALPPGGPMPFEQSLAFYPPPGEVVAGGGEGMALVSFAAPAIGTLYGYNFSASAGDANVEVQRRVIQRSDERVFAPLFNRDGEIIGQLQLSDGPAYGREIVNSVARAWAISGLLAVILAAGVGVLVSRRMAAPVLALTAVTGRMAEGDLSARASVEAPEELAALGHSFNEMAARVEEMVSTLRNFVSDAAHELHTPLTALRTDLEIAAELPPSSFTPELASRALIQADRLQVLVNNLLNLSRIESNEHPHTPVNLSALYREMGELYASRAEQAGISFSLTHADPSIEVLGNEIQIRSALGNLLENAIKFTPQGGHIQFFLEKEQAGWEFSVTDNGIGVPSEEIPHLFRRFHRARNVSDFSGNGLGLAIVKAIAEAHHGQVGVENLTQGTRFSFWIPE